MRVTLPRNWSEEQLPPGMEAADYLAIGPRGYLNCAPTVLVAHADDVELPLREWAEGVAELSSQQYPTFHVLDTATMPIDGHDALVYLASFPTDGVNLTQMQFSLLGEIPGTGRARGYVITTTCPTADFPTLADPLVEIATSFRIEGES
ncbi:MAG: hypothetical protein Q3979_02445 [Actinomycetaceae bacterium]|nr:hypothetical protein [Actinomycetaceae bacterium]